MSGAGNLGQLAVAQQGGVGMVSAVRGDPAGVNGFNGFNSFNSFLLKVLTGARAGKPARSHERRGLGSILEAVKGVNALTKNLKRGKKLRMGAQVV